MMRIGLLTLYYLGVGVFAIVFASFPYEGGLPIAIKILLGLATLLFWPLAALASIAFGPERIAGILALSGFPLIVGVCAAIDAQTKAKRKAHASAVAQEQARLASLDAERRREEERDLQLDRRRSEVASLVLQSERAIGSLSEHVRGAGRAVYVAEREFSEGLFSPFWDAMESAIQHLACFNATLDQLTAARERHRTLTASLPGESHPFPRIPGVPGVNGVTEKLRVLYRSAQKNPTFAQIYEQRRQTTILEHGFRSMQEAIEGMGGKLTAQMSLLGMDLRDGIGGIKDSVEAVGNRVVDFSEQSADAARAAAQLDDAQIENQERALGELGRIRKKLGG